MSKQYDIIGKKFNKLQVISRAENRNTRQSWWTCKCDCGSIKDIRGIKLINGLTKSCGCIKKNNYAYNFSGIGDLSGKYWSRIKKHALKRNLDFDLTLAEAWEVFNKQNGKCALSGLEIILERNLEKKGQTASLDRIDSSKGYSKDNIQWVHVDVNKLKNNLSEDRLFLLCQLIVNNCCKNV